MSKFGKSTGELFTELKEEKNLGGYLQRNRDELILPLNEYLEKLLAEKNLTKKNFPCRRTRRPRRGFCLSWNRPQVAVTR